LSVKPVKSFIAEPIASPDLETLIKVRYTAIIGATSAGDWGRSERCKQYDGIYQGGHFDVTTH